MDEVPVQPLGKTHSYPVAFASLVTEYISELSVEVVVLPLIALGVAGVGLILTSNAILSDSTPFTVCET